MGASGVQRQQKAETATPHECLPVFELEQLRRKDVKTDNTQPKQFCLQQLQPRLTEERTERRQARQKATEKEGKQQQAGEEKNEKESFSLHGSQPQPAWQRQAFQRKQSQVNVHSSLSRRRAADAMPLFRSVGVYGAAAAQSALGVSAMATAAERRERRASSCASAGRRVAAAVAVATTAFVAASAAVYSYNCGAAAHPQSSARQAGGLPYFEVQSAEPGSDAAAAALAVATAEALQRLRHLDLLRTAASPSAVVTLSPDTYNSLFLRSLPPPLPPAAAAGRTSETAAETHHKRRRRRALYFATWRREPSRPYHLFLLLTFLVPDEMKQQLPYPRCPECSDAFHAFNRIAQAYKRLEEQQPARSSWWNSREEKSRRGARAALSVSPDEAPVFFVVANLALLNHLLAFHGLHSLPAIVYVPATTTTTQQQQQQQHAESSFGDIGGEREEEDYDVEEDDDPDLFDNEADPVKRMQAAAPSPFPRPHVLMLQRATADAGIERAILEWMNMKTKRAVDLPSSVWTEGGSLCVLVTLLLLLLLLARAVVSLLPRYPWLLPGVACVFYWLTTSGLVFSLYNRVPLYGFDVQSEKRIFVAPGRGQFFLEGFLMSGCSVLVAAAGTALVHFPHSLRLPTRRAAAAAAMRRKRALETFLNLIKTRQNGDKSDNSNSTTSNSNSTSNSSTSSSSRTSSSSSGSSNSTSKNSTSNSSTSSSSCSRKSVRAHVVDPERDSGNNCCGMCQIESARVGEVESTLRKRRDKRQQANHRAHEAQSSSSASDTGVHVLNAAAGGAVRAGGFSAATGRKEPSVEEEQQSLQAAKKALSDTTGDVVDQLLFKLIQAEQRERRLHIRSGLHINERVCLAVSMVVAALIFIGAASIELQGFRYKSPWYKASFFPAPEYLRGPMRVDRGNAF